MKKNQNAEGQDPQPVQFITPLISSAHDDSFLINQKRNRSSRQQNVTIDDPEERTAERRE
jgi:hypothetical protein